jgi:hypothetical protein
MEPAMSRTSAILVLVLGALAASPIAASADPVADLHALFDREWERDLADNPLSATYLGDPRYNDRLPDVSPAAEAAMRTGLDRALEGKTYLAVETGCGKLLEGQGCSKRLKTEGPWSC